MNVAKAIELCEQRRAECVKLAKYKAGDIVALKFTAPMGNRSYNVGRIVNVHDLLISGEPAYYIQPKHFRSLKTWLFTESDILELFSK